MQHGSHTTESIMRGVAAITLVGKPAIVRIPIGRFETASRALDFGAAAVIAPMVNSVADAKAFGAAMKFPPLGERSWGPTRVIALHGAPSLQAYLESANSDTLAIAMIETRAAQAVLDEILALDTIDGVFVGPSDFSIALSNGAKVDAEQHRHVEGRRGDCEEDRSTPGNSPARSPLRAKRRAGHAILVSA